MFSILSKRLSSFLCLLIVVLFALVMGVIIVRQSQKLVDLQKPLPLYVPFQ